MKRNIVIILLLLFCWQPEILPQFGKNKVQYKEFTWYYIQTKHFDIYFSSDAFEIAEFSAKAMEDALASVEKTFNYRINNRITLILYNSQNDFQETNTIDEYLSEGIGGFTELFKNRIVLPFTGSYKAFRHVLHHELVHAVVNDMFYGGSLQNVIANNISIRLPLWFNEGLAEYESLGWDTNTDMFIRDAAINEYLPDVEYLDGYFAYRGGQAVFYYIAQKYGKEKIGELINRIKGSGSVEEGFKAALGLNIKEFSERWKKEIRRTYWPDISIRKDPDEFAKRLTDHRKDGGFYNTSPAISPQGDKLAFISNRNFYFDVFLMSAIDGKIIKRIIKGNRTADFEELNILTPGLTWSPDGTKIALSAKSNGADVIYIIDVETTKNEVINFPLEGISSVQWSPDGSKLAFTGHTASQSDIYIYNFSNKELINLTDDIFSDNDPAWSPDGEKIFFISDRTHYISKNLPEDFKIYNYDYSQNDLYYFNIKSSEIKRITATEMASESSPVIHPNGKEVLYISDENGINNIYKKSLETDDNTKSYVDIKPIPVTNSLNGLYQLSLSKDGKKLALTSMYQAAYNIFLMNNPFEINLEMDSLPLTVYYTELNKKLNAVDLTDNKEEEKEVNNNNQSKEGVEIFTGQFVDTTKTYGDSIQIDFSTYVFGDDKYARQDSVKDLAIFNLTDNLDEDGNYKVNKYKITFSPDIVYANAGYSSLYGLLGTTIISFSDVLGNHRLIGLTSLQIDLKNSDYGLAYYYLPKRINYGIEAFHTARFVFLSRGINNNLFRFRNYGLSLSASLPINRFYRFDAGLSMINVTGDNLDNPNENLQQNFYLLPSLNFVHDNVLWGYTSPIDGTRYRFDLFGNPGINDSKRSFYSVLGDYRTYMRFWTDYSFVFRLSGGFSAGANPQRFFIGGTDNWINRTFATGEIPLESTQDFAFLTAALPLRGYNYAEQIGSKYTLMNLELRFPLIRYLVTGALPILFRDIMGVAFIDAGAAWNDSKKLQLFSRNDAESIRSKDLLIGTGVGARMYFLFFLVRFDVAWSYTVDSFSKPKYYFSLGADF